MNQWCDDVIDQIKRRYELSPKEFAESLNGMVLPSHQGADEKPQPAPGDTPRNALLRYRTLLDDRQSLCEALKAKRRYMIEQWPEGASDNGIFWMEKDLECLDEYLQRRAGVEFKRVEVLAVADPRPEHVEVLMELFFSPSTHLELHADILDFLSQLGANAWEEHFLVSLERLSFDQIWKRAYDYTGALCECRHIFSNSNRVLSLLASWQQQLVERIAADNVVTPAISPEEKLLNAIFGSSSGDCPGPHAALEAVKKARVEFEFGRDEVPKECGTPSLTLCDLVRSHDFMAIEKMLSEGADIDQRDGMEGTALHLACRLGRPGMTGFLLEKCADVHAQDSGGKTPLHVAAWHGNQRVAEILLERGACVNAKSNCGDTPLYSASSQGHVDMTILLLSKGAAVAARNSIGRTPLHDVAGCGAIRDRHYYVDLVIALLDNGADVNAADDSGMTALHCAAEANCDDIAEVLLVRGACPNATDAMGRSPLHLATQRANDHVVRDMVKLLLKQGADPHLKDHDGRSPIDWAMSIGHVPLLNLLQRS